MSFIANFKKKIGLTTKKRLILICYLFIFMFLATAFQTVKVRAVDDNYSTYLYNQDINVDNDKAHLLQDNSDGSNSYRNLFQSDFLFPAKLQNDLLSTGQTSAYAGYSFNQYYFDNLNHQYNYQNSNSNDNLYQDVDFENDYDLEVGNSLRNGSINDIGYNATYTFDNYNETESNFGNYYMSEYNDFNNEIIGTTGINIEWINYTVDNPDSIIISEVNNHKNVLSFQDGYNGHYISQTKSETFEFFTNSPDNTKNIGMMLVEGQSRNILILKFSFYDSYFEYHNGTDYIEVQLSSINEWYHHRIVIRDDNSFDWYINSILIVDNETTSNDMINGIDRIIMYSQDFGHKYYLDAFGIVNDDDSYNLNDNTNPYGLQTELDNDFEVNYDYSLSYFINSESNYYNNYVNITDNSNSNYAYFYDSFTSQTSGIIEFRIKTNNTVLYNTVKFGSIYLFTIQANKFKYMLSGSSWTDIPNVENPLINTWYNIKIFFNATSDTMNCFVNKIDSGILNIPTFTSFSSLLFGTQTSGISSLCIDNIDYSWTNGYYENRSTELNGHKFETEIESEHTYILYPNYIGFDTGWTPYPSGTEITVVDDTNNQSDYIYTNAGATILYEFQDLPSEFDGYSFSVDIVFTAYGVGSSCYTSIDGWGAVMYYPTGSYVNYSRSGIKSYSQITNTDISFAGNPVPDTLRICSVFMVVHYSYNGFKVNYEQEFNNDYDLPVSYELMYLVQTDTSLITDFSIYNYDIEEYTLFDSLNCYENYNISSFVLNESAYFRFNKVKFQLNISHNYYDSEIIIVYFILRITYVVQNDFGYQELIHYNHRYDNVDTYIGYNKLEVQIYKNSLKYRYSEVNFFTDDYIYSFTVINTSDINVENIEIQTHCRYGLNTLDVEIINIYYQIYINYNVSNVIEFREQSRKDLTGIKVKSSFNYTTYNSNYLDLTGIIGNYSYNSFNGMRSLYGASTELFHRYFNIPFFSDDIDVSIPLILPVGTEGNPNEPSAPSGTYWNYETFETQYYQNVPINVGNWSIEFRQMKSVVVNAKYYYETETISRDDLGSWKWKIKFSDAFSYTVDFNFMRNAIVSILNLVLLFAQYIMFFCVAGLSYIFMFIGTNILVFLWNYLIYYLYIGLLTILWYIYNGLYLLLMWLWSALLWIYEVVLIPAYIWISEVAVPYLVEFVIIPAVAFTLTLIIWILTLGRLDFWTLYEVIKEQLFILSDGFNEILLELIEHIVVVILFIALYLLLIGMCYVKMLVVKVRGYVNRSNALEESLNTYLYPVIIFYKICLAIKQLIANWF